MLRDDKGDMTSIMIGLMVALIIFAVALATIMPTINTSCEYQAVVNETFNSSAQDVWIQLGNTSIVSGSETVTTTDGATTYTRDTDYKMNYTDGKIMSLSTGLYQLQLQGCSLHRKRNNENDSEVHPADAGNCCISRNRRRHRKVLNMNNTGKGGQNDKEMGQGRRPPF